ncbi:efflux RND transporter permease subunit [Thalassotalea sp. LPB0316]|uniref:efflux RND transporter permease subunit n=1 Tax=Thalassotalea sp. LPB0316 TaxID=2769490 RepID=UPI0018680CF4|nr:efflux RND transporter permease subunit [Thalassotalea sp. LPB0316]QOL26801.1 efflux RND transporter permease subunit [Thalassotalea sp. LPB0316]
MIRAFVKNGRLMSLAIALIVVAGLGALSTLPRTEDPRITNRIASAITEFPGASAERVEVLVTEKVEQKLRKLPEVKLISSVSRANISVVKIQLHDEVVDTKPIWSRVRDLLNDTRPELPNGANSPTLIDDRGYAYTQLFAINWRGSGEVDLAALGRYANELQNRLRNITGTDIVSIYGRGQEEIQVEIDHELTSQVGLTSAQVSQRLLTADAKVSAGEIVNPYTQMQVELDGAFSDIERIRNIPIKQADNGSILRLGDIATVDKDLHWPASEIAIVNNQRAVIVGTRMLEKVRIDLWSEKVNKEIALFEQQLPSNIALEVLFDQNTYTSERLSDLVNNIVVGFTLITAVLMVTLGWRAAIIVALSLPLSVLFTLAVMNFYGLPIHQMSVTGLVVALGIMVDNAIVMTDTIQQRRQQGVGRLDSVGYAVKHLWLPLLGSTITTILAFMPIVLMPGPAGEFVSGIALSVIFSLIASYLISHTIVAGLAGRFIEKDKSEKGGWLQHGIHLPKLSKAFESSLHFSMRHMKKVMLAVMCLPLFGFWAAGTLTEQFFPPSDRDMFQIELFMPANSSILATEKVALDITDYLNQVEGINHTRWLVGKNMPSFYYNLAPENDGSKHYAQAMVTTDHFSTTNRLIPILQKALDQRFPQGQIIVRKLEQGPPFAAPVELRIYGPNLDELKRIGDHVRQVMSTVDNVIHTRASLQAGAPKVWLNADEAQVMLSGLTLVDVANQLSNTLNGKVNGSLIEVTESIPVRVSVDNQSKNNISQLHDIQLVSPHASQPIPLSAISTMSIAPTRGAIPHREGVRVNTIAGYITAGVLPSQVLSDILAAMEASDFHVPNGYHIEIGGESAERDSTVGQLMASVGLIMTLLFTVVVLSFNSFRISAIILLSAFQSIGLGLFSVFVFDYPFGFTVIIGLLGLMGLAINAAIVIIAELKSNQAAINGDKNAIVASVLSCGRHISSTTITTVGGFLPLILAGGGFWPPFAIAIAGGTVLTTILSFYFVPTCFAWLNQKKPFELTMQAA